MVTLGDSRVLYRLNEVLVYLADINEITDDNANITNGVDCAEIITKGRAATICTNAQKFICAGPLCILDTGTDRVMTVGPLDAAMFTYDLPDTFCVLSMQEITCRGSTESELVVIQIVKPGISDMDELVNVLRTWDSLVHQPRYDDDVERLAYRLRVAGKHVGLAIGKASAVAAQGIEKVGAVVRDNITPNTTEAEIPPDMKKAVLKTRESVEALCQGVDYLNARAVYAAQYVVEKAASGIQENASEENASVTKGQIIAKSAVAASIDVWRSVQQAKEEVGTKCADATAKTVGHKYGGQAEAVTRDGLHAVGNVIQVAQMRTPGKFLLCAGELAAVGAGKTVVDPVGKEKNTTAPNPQPRDKPLRIGRNSVETASVSDLPPLETSLATSATESQFTQSSNMASNSSLPNAPCGTGLESTQEIDSAVVDHEQSGIDRESAQGTQSAVVEQAEPTRNSSPSNCLRKEPVTETKPHARRTGCIGFCCSVRRRRPYSRAGKNRA